MLTISATEISSIQVVGESKNKVLFVSQRNSNRLLVVKSEETKVSGGANLDGLDCRNNVGAMLEFHGTMFSKLRSLPFDTEKVTLSEINALRSCSSNKVRGLKAGETWPAILDSDILYQHGRLKAVVKISYIEEVADLSKMTKSYEQITAMRTCLENGDTSFVFELGEILAVDFFIGNHDRFGEKGKLVGPQNIFLRVKDGAIKATGIDTYDVFGKWSDLNKTIEDLEKTGGKWPGRILAPGAVKLRDVVAENAVTDIILMSFEGITGREGFPKASTIGPRRKKALVTEFHKGMSEAKSGLRKKYKLGDNVSALQNGIRSRWNIIRG